MTRSKTTQSKTTATDNIIEDEKYTTADLMRLFGVSKMTVHNWQRHGVKGHTLRGLKIGDRRFFMRADVERFIEASTAGATRGDC